MCVCARSLADVSKKAIRKRGNAAKLVQKAAEKFLDVFGFELVQLPNLRESNLKALKTGEGTASKLYALRLCVPLSSRLKLAE